MAVSPQVGEIRNRDSFAPDLATKFRHLLMRALQKLIQNAEFVHDFKRRRMDGIAAEITKKIRVFLEHDNVNALARKEKAQHYAGGTTSDDATASVDRFIHAN